MTRFLPRTAEGNPPCWELLALLRFFLALVVACGHLQWFSGTSIAWANVVGQFGGKAAVVGFLLVSGFAIAASQQKQSKGFLRRRAYRIYPLYLCSLVFAFGLELHFHTIALPGITLESLGWKTFVGNVLLLQTFLVKPIAFNGPVWSLSIEFSYYLLAALLLPRLPRPLLLAVVALSVLCYLLPRRDDLGLLYLLASKFNALKYLWCWVAGYLFWHHRSLASAGPLMCGALVVAWSEDSAGALDAFTYALTVLLLAGSFHISIKGWLGKVCVFLGDLSYPLYLFHLPAFLFAYAGLGLRPPEALAAVAMLVSLAGLLLVDYFLKPRYLQPRWPGQPPMADTGRGTL